MNLRRRIERDLERDIQDHIEMETRDNIERGMSPEEARSAARRKFGNVLRVMEETRAVWRWMWFERLLQDVRYGLRTLRRNPLFAGVVVLTLAMGIGMSTAVFSVIRAVLLKPLSYPDSQRLVWVANFIEPFQAELVSGADFFDWRSQSQSFDRMVSYGYTDRTIADGHDADQSTIAEVNGDFWPVAGVSPLHGRLFRGEERDVIVLSHSLFQRRFGGDSAVVGKTLTVDGRTVTVTGVLPASFRFLFPTPQRPDVHAKEIDAYEPDVMTPQNRARGSANAIVNVVARLKPGVSLEHARTELEGIQARIARQNRSISYAGVSLRVLPLREKLVGNSRRALLILFGAAVFVLLIACANVASLLLARAAARQREIAIRAAVGAGQARVIAQLLVEGMLLSVAGGALGLVLAQGAIFLLVHLGSRAVPRLESTSIDGSVMAFTLLVSIVSALLFSLGPAISLVRANLRDKLSERSPTGRKFLRLRPQNVLVAGELAIALVLVTGAGLMLKSLWQMHALPAGLHPERILVMKAALSGPAYSTQSRQVAYFEEALGRLRRAPGVVAAGTVFSPVRGVVEVEGARPMTPDQAPRAVYYSTSSGYFRVMGIRLLSGRWMTDHESPGAVLVNESFVRNAFGGRNPLGQRIRLPLQQPPIWAEIAGVVSNVKASSLDVDPEPEIYFPYRQSPFNRVNDVVVLAAGDPLAMTPSLRKLVSDMDRSQPVFGVQTLERVLSESIAPRRFNLMVLGTFAGSALLLTLVGIYGAMSYAVTQRTQEIGIRLALGARRGEVIRMIVQQGMTIAVAGISVGIAAALGITRVMASLLQDVRPDDPATFFAVAITLAATAIVSAWVPALRAARVDPLLALRHE